MSQESTRRKFLHGGALATAGLLAGAVTQAAQGQNKPVEHQHDDMSDSEFPRDHPGPGGLVGSSSDRGKLVPGQNGAGDKPVPVITPDLTKLFWEMKGDVKEFHLHCGHTRREFLPHMWFDVWGFNDSMPGPTIEAVEGDRVRIVVHNELPESTTIHWHGLEVPNRMDGVHGLTQEPIKPGETFVYEFELHQNGTFFYHSHGPMQEGMGMAGLFIIHPRSAHSPPVDKDFALLIQEWAILPECTVPNTMSMEFNFFTINGRSAPYVTPLVVRLGDRVRIRFVNMSPIDHHPMHLHGHTFWITGTEAGRIPESAWIPSNNVLVGVAQARDVEFIANNPGDWMIHCHMFHHMMNHMVSMVGPMAHMGHGMPAGGDMANSLGMITRGPALAEEHGAHLGRGMGEQTGREREVRHALRPGDQHSGHSQRRPSAGQQHGPHGGQGSMQHPGEIARLVPGYPQDMMDMHGMHSDEDLKRINKPETRGMRHNWYAGVEALMTVLRVLPADLYDQVMSGEGEIPPGASVPGADSGKMPHHGQKHQGHPPGHKH
jgi:FtsP/CotA-like multicopper oxidase with cupredoxin domain